MLVETRSDLVLKSTWQQLNGDIWTYPGMVVSVASDVNPANNGVYMLIDADFTIASNWQKMASVEEIAYLQEQIDNLEISGGSLDVEVETEESLPEEGDENATYFVKENLSIQRWDDETGTYISYGGAPELDINIINGGNSNG